MFDATKNISYVMDIGEEATEHVRKHWHNLWSTYSRKADKTMSALSYNFNFKRDEIAHETMIAIRTLYKNGLMVILSVSV